MIPFVCPECEQPIRAKDKLAGIEQVCPHCQAKVTVPRLTDEQKIMIYLERLAKQGAMIYSRLGWILACLVLTAIGSCGTVVVVQNR